MNWHKILFILLSLITILHYSCSQSLLYFKDSLKSNERVNFGNGSIFRAGGGGKLANPVTEFYCQPNDMADAVTWLYPNGDSVPLESVDSSGIYVREGANGTRILVLNNAISEANDGLNFTCAITDFNTNEMYFHYFGIYNAASLTILSDFYGIRIYTQDNPPVVYEFMLQKGIFNFDLSQPVNIQCLNNMQTDEWKFDPEVGDDYDNKLFITNVSFNQGNDNVCQKIACRQTAHYGAVSDQPFLIREQPNWKRNFDESQCFQSNTVYGTFNVSDPLEIGVSCPLEFGGQFLDISEDDFYLQKNKISEFDPTRLFVEADKTPAAIKHERDYVCRDKYGTEAKFKVLIFSPKGEGIRIYNSSSALTHIDSESVYKAMDLPVKLFCLYENNTFPVYWYYSNYTLPMQNLEIISNDANNNMYATEVRDGRSDLSIKNTSMVQEGFYYCGNANLNILTKFGVFNQPPNSPISNLTILNPIDNYTICDLPDILAVCSNSNPSSYPTQIEVSWLLNSETVFTFGNNLYASLFTAPGLYNLTCTVSNSFATYSSAPYLLNVFLNLPTRSVNNFEQGTSTIFFTEDSFTFFYFFHSCVNLTLYLTKTLLVSGSPLIVPNFEIQFFANYSFVITLGYESLVPGDTKSFSFRIEVDSKVFCTEEVYLRVFAPSPPAPPVISVQSISQYSIMLNWSISTNFVYLPESYSILYCLIAACNFQAIPNIASNSYLLDNLMPDSEYQIIVEATNQFGSTNGTAVIANTTPLLTSSMEIEVQSTSIFTQTDDFTMTSTPSGVEETITSFMIASSQPDVQTTTELPSSDIFSTSVPEMTSTFTESLETTPFTIPLPTPSSTIVQTVITLTPSASTIQDLTTFIETAIPRTSTIGDGESSITILSTFTDIIVETPDSMTPGGQTDFSITPSESISQDLTTFMETAIPRTSMADESSFNTLSTFTVSLEETPFTIPTPSNTIEQSLTPSVSSTQDFTTYMETAIPRTSTIGESSLTILSTLTETLAETPSTSPTPLNTIGQTVVTITPSDSSIQDLTTFMGTAIPSTSIFSESFFTTYSSDVVKPTTPSIVSTTPSIVSTMPSIVSTTPSIESTFSVTYFSNSTISGTVQVSNSSGITLTSTPTPTHTKSTTTTPIATDGSTPTIIASASIISVSNTIKIVLGVAICILIVLILLLILILIIALNPTRKHRIFEINSRRFRPYKTTIPTLTSWQNPNTLATFSKDNAYNMNPLDEGDLLLRDELYKNTSHSHGYANGPFSSNSSLIASPPSSPDSQHNETTL